MRTPAKLAVMLFNVLASDPADFTAPGKLAVEYVVGASEPTDLGLPLKLVVTVPSVLAKVPTLFTEPGKAAVTVASVVLSVPVSFTPPDSATTALSVVDVNVPETGPAAAEVRRRRVSMAYSTMNTMSQAVAPAAEFVS